jgi:hypothetical protein
LVNIGMTNSREQNLDVHAIGSNWPKRDLSFFEARGWTGNQKRLGVCQFFLLKGNFQQLA